MKLSFIFLFGLIENKSNYLNIYIYHIQYLQNIQPPYSNTSSLLGKKIGLVI